MKVIKADLPNTLDKIQLHIFADEHIGDMHCDIERLKSASNMLRTQRMLIAYSTETFLTMRAEAV